MEPRKVFHKREYRLPKTSFTLSGYSRAAYRSGFYINGLGICLDAGPQMFKRVTHYFVTHCHTDHIANLPYSLIGDSEIETADGKIRPMVYCPTEMVNLLDDKIMTSFRANYGTTKADSRIRSFYEVRGVDPGDRIEFTANRQKLVITAVDADHSVPTRLYGLSTIKKKLMPEFEGLAQNELRDLARSGTQLSGYYEEPLLSYVMDTSIRVLESHPELLDYPTVIIECTFLLDDPEERMQAENKKHIHWSDLRSYVQDRPETMFILTHFSLKYTDEEIQDFFREQIREHALRNVYPWLTDIEFSLEDHEEHMEGLKDYEDSVVDDSIVAIKEIPNFKGVGQLCLFYLFVFLCMLGGWYLLLGR